MMRDDEFTEPILDASELEIGDLITGDEGYIELVIDNQKPNLKRKHKGSISVIVLFLGDKENSYSAKMKRWVHMMEIPFIPYSTIHEQYRKLKTFDDERSS